MKKILKILFLLLNVALISQCSSAAFDAINGNTTKNEDVEDDSIIKHDESRPTEEGEGLPGYLTDPKLIKITKESNENQYTISGDKGAVASEKGDVTQVIVYVWTVPKKEITTIAKSDKTYGYVTANLLAQGPVDAEGRFEILYTNTSTDTVIVSAARYVDNQTRIDLEGMAREGTVVTFNERQDSGINCPSPPCKTPVSFGTGTFGEPIEIASPYMTNSFVARERDGKVEVVQANVAGNNSYFTVGANWELSAYSELDIFQEDSTELFLVDVNGDSRPDLINTNRDDLDYIYYAQEDGSFSGSNAIGALVNGGTRVRAADFDGDGDQDIIVFARPNDTANLHENDGSGNFGFGSGVAVGEVSAGGQNCADVGDFDGDGKVDFVYGRWNSELYLYKNDGNLSFSQFAKLEIPNDPNDNSSNRVCRDLKLIDDDLDGDLDIIMANRYANRIYRNDGQGGFTEHFDLSETKNSFGLQVVDINADTFPDLVFQNRKTPTQVYLNDKNGSFLSPTEVGPALEADYETPSLLVADFNGDRILDILVGDRNQNDSNYLIPGE